MVEQESGVKISELSGVKRKLTVHVPEPQVAAAVEAALKTIQKTAKLKGFRPGKVPMQLIEKNYGADLEREAMEQILQRTYPDAVMESKLQPISRPDITPGPFTKGQAFSYEATFEIRPTVEVKEFKGLKLTRPPVDVIDAEVEAQLQRIRESMTQLVPVEEGTGATAGMVARVDFDGTVDGKAFEGSKADDFVVEIGSGNLLAEFENQFEGMKVGDEREVAITYPDDYFNLSLAGSQAVFHVTLQELKKKMLPELTDDFAKDLGEFQGLADVRKAIREQIEANKEYAVQQQLGEDAMKQLLEKHDIELPETMIGWELSTMFQQMEQQLKQEGKTMEQAGVTSQAFVEQYTPIARDRAKSYLLLEAIAQTEHLTVEEDEVEGRLKAIADSTGEPLPKVKLHYEQKKLIPALRIELLHQKALDFVIKSSKIKVEKPKKEKKASK